MTDSGFTRCAIGIGPLVFQERSDETTCATRPGETLSRCDGPLGMWLGSTKVECDPITYQPRSGNCAAAVIQKHPDFETAKAACSQNPECTAVYETSKGEYQERKSCCTVEPRPGWCKQSRCEKEKVGEVHCNLGQGGTTYFKTVGT